MKGDLKVIPLLKYKSPKYPSFNGIDPLNPERKDISKSSYYMAALLGAVGLFSFTNVSKVPKENPIKFNELGFPHTYAMYGTGLPDRLDREKAMAIIDSVFKVNDIKLVKDYPISESGVNFHATGYNTESRIGYVWLDYANTAQDCYNSWRGSYVGYEDLLEEDREVFDKLGEEDYKGRQKFMNNLNVDKGYYKLVSLKEHLYGNPELQKEIREYITDNLNKASANYGKEIWEKYDNQVVDIKEMEKIVDSKKFDIAAFSQYSSVSTYYSYQNESKETAIKKLEVLVQDYIDWAKSEGRY